MVVTLFGLTSHKGRDAPMRLRSAASLTSKHRRDGGPAATALLATRGETT
jgi:hypothetical protein